VAIGVPLAIHLITVGLNLALGAPAPSLAQFSPWYAVIAVFALRLVNPLDGPMGEEPGWRGFALPRLQAGRSPLLATLILALVVTVWHVPLLLPQFGASPIDLLTTFAVTVWYAWLFNRTGGSVLMTLIAHSTEGSIQFGAFWASLGRSCSADGLALLRRVVRRCDRLVALRPAILARSCTSVRYGRAGV